ncbi:MAG: hydrogenase expression/formation protein HypE [Pseudomonadota bacterium]
MKKEFKPECPAPIPPGSTILLAHGGGGSLMHNLIRDVFVKAFEDQRLQASHDAATMNLGGERLAFTTDSYVVRPLFFPGGDIGKLAVCGTANDLAMAGAEPLALSSGFILEEGFDIGSLERIAQSMSKSAEEVGVALVTGDTKVVERGKGDGLYVNTSGIGVIRLNADIHPRNVKAGDAVIVSGDLGRHGIAVMSAREGLSFETVVQSDCAHLWPAVHRLLDAGITVHCLRDLTRGGLSSALNEIARTRAIRIGIREKEIQIIEGVSAACEILGLDPLYVANEGRFVAFVPGNEAERAVSVLKKEPVSAGAAVIGEVIEAGAPSVTMTTKLGTKRVIDLLSGEQLPRIC